MPNAAQVVDEPVPDNDEPIIVVDKDKEQQYSDVSICFKHEAMPREAKAGIEYLVYEYAKGMITRMLNTRLSDMAQEPDCPFDRASCYDSEYILANTMDAFTIDAMPKEGQAEAATQALLVEAMRAAPSTASQPVSTAAPATST